MVSALALVACRSQPYDDVGRATNIISSLHEQLETEDRRAVARLQPVAGGLAAYRKARDVASGGWCDAAAAAVSGLRDPPGSIAVLCRVLGSVLAGVLDDPAAAVDGGVLSCRGAFHWQLNGMDDAGLHFDCHAGNDGGHSYG